MLLNFSIWYFSILPLFYCLVFCFLLFWFLFFGNLVLVKKVTFSFDFDSCEIMWKRGSFICWHVVCPWLGLVNFVFLEMKGWVVSYWHFAMFGNFASLFLWFKGLLCWKEVKSDSLICEMKHDIFHVVLSPDWLLVVFDFVLIASSLFACKYLVVRLHRYGGDLFSQGHILTCQFFTLGKFCFL